MFTIGKKQCQLMRILQKLTGSLKENFTRVCINVKHHVSFCVCTVDTRNWTSLRWAATCCWPRREEQDHRSDPQHLLHLLWIHHKQRPGTGQLEEASVFPGEFFHTFWHRSVFDILIIQTFKLEGKMNFSNCTDLFLNFFFPFAEKNTGKIGQCFVFVWTRSRTHKKSFSKMPFKLKAQWISTPSPKEASPF